MHLPVAKDDELVQRQSQLLSDGVLFGLGFLIEFALGHEVRDVADLVAVNSVIGQLVDEDRVDDHDLVHPLVEVDDVLVEDLLSHPWQLDRPLQGVRQKVDVADLAAAGRRKAVGIVSRVDRVVVGQIACAIAVDRDVEVIDQAGSEQADQLLISRANPLAGN